MQINKKYIQEVTKSRLPENKELKDVYLDICNDILFKANEGLTTLSIYKDNYSKEVYNNLEKLFKLDNYEIIKNKKEIKLFW